MNKKINAALAIAVIIIIAGGITVLVLFNVKKQNQKSNEMPSQAKTEIEVKKNQTVSEVVANTESISCGGKNYNAEIYNLEGIDVVKRIVQLLGESCKFSIAGNNIGIENQNNSRTYTIYLYDKDKGNGPFEDPTKDRVFVIDLDKNTVSNLVNEFAGNTKIIGKFK